MAKSTNKTTIKKEAFISQYFSKVGNISELCKAIGIHRSTYYVWMDKDKGFKIKVDAEFEALIDFAESKLLKLIDDKNVAAVIFFLKTRARSRGYIERVDTEHSGNIDHTVFIMPRPKKKKKGDAD